jgi:hypothetical protein
MCARGIGFASVLCARGIGFAPVLRVNLVTNTVISHE